MADMYANVMNASVVTNGAAYVNTEIQTGASLQDKRGILIDEIDYTYDPDMVVDLIAGGAGDYARAGWGVQEDQQGYNNNRVIHEFFVHKWTEGTPASSSLIHAPFTFRFTPPLIVAAQKLYFTTICSAAIAATTFFSRVYFRYVALKTEEYLEIAESFVLTS